MQTVLIVIHLMIVLALVAVVLLQRSEGGGLGIGGGGGNMMSSRSSGNALTRITGILAFAFFITSLSLGILARYSEGPSSILDRIEQQTEGSGEGILDQLGGSGAPQTETTPDGQADVPAALDEGEAAPATGADADTDQVAPEGDAGDSAPQSEPASPGVPTGQ
ncbi:preprotein translocase subunit SecG [Pararhizobium haloflavum]|uniref:preprotein translocase subunit SecG n=1 Tax=Pararhizobium haloflavum TaxID=2037914 RepID=UPI000C1A7488|nr:preprotein translocase subunit SecG [Pararhizobium haloflavum]